MRFFSINLAPIVYEIQNWHPKRYWLFRNSTGKSIFVHHYQWWKLVYNPLTLLPKMCSLTRLFRKHGKERKVCVKYKTKSSCDFLPYQSNHTCTDLNKRWDSTFVFWQTKQKKVAYSLIQNKERVLHFLNLEQFRKNPQIQIKIEVLFLQKAVYSS